VSWSESKVTIDLDRQAIKDAPSYDEGALIERDAQLRIYNHYGDSPLSASRPTYAAGHLQDLNGSSSCLKLGSGDVACRWPRLRKNCFAIATILLSFASSRVSTPDMRAARSGLWRCM
jgi:hypothetical protein